MKKMFNLCRRCYKWCRRTLRSMVPIGTFRIVYNYTIVSDVGYYLHHIRAGANIKLECHNILGPISN